MGGDPAHLPPRFPIQGVRTAQQDVYDLMAQARSFLYSGDMWRQLAGHSAYDDLGITNDRFTQWAPLNQSLYVGYKVMLAGLLLHRQGGPRGDELVGRGAVPAPGRRRDRVLRVDRAGVQAARVHRQVAAPPGGRADAPAADRQPAQDDVPRQPFRGVPRPEPPAPGSISSSAASRSRRPASSTPTASLRERAAQVRYPRITPKRIIMDLSLTCVVATQLWHHTFLGGGLCDLPTWTRTPLRQPIVPSLDVFSNVDAACSPRAEYSSQQ